MKTLTVEVCTERQLHWISGDGEPGCIDMQHDHRLVEVHQHLDRIALPDGTSITATSFNADETYRREKEPDFGLYLDPRWSPPWPHSHLDWPDFGVPSDLWTLESTLRHVLELARSGQDVEIGCLGGHGRTGTTIACLAVLSGLPASRAVDWVRNVYCSRSVETPEQAAFVEAFGAATASMD